MAELTNAAEMANAAGIDPETFREALRGSDFAWHKPPDDWTVEIDSPQHASMRTELLLVLLKVKPVGSGRASMTSTETATGRAAKRARAAASRSLRI